MNFILAGGKEDMKGDAGDLLSQTPFKNRGGSLESYDVLNGENFDNILVNFELSMPPSERKGIKTVCRKNKRVSSF